MKYASQKQLLLQLLNILQTETDEEEGITMEQIRVLLTQSGFDPDRKSIYACFDALEAHGLDVQRPAGKRRDYRLLKSADELELSEVKLLIDAIQASRFLSRAKAEKLTRKLEKLVSRRQARNLHRQMIISDRVKSMNNSIYYHVDALHSAIAQDRMVSFRYFDYSMSKKRVYRHDGQRYHASPFAMIYNNDKYYLLAVPEGGDAMRTYRVDKLDSVQLLEAPRTGHDIFSTVDLSTYTQYTFSMYAGTPRSVTMRFANELVSIALDRFGHDIVITRDGDTHFRFTATIAVSPRFYGWLYSFGAGVEILDPPEVRGGMQQLLRETAALYGGQEPDC